MLPEKIALANLSKLPYKVVSQEITLLSELFDRLRKVEDTSVRLSPFELYEAHWATLGLMGRTYELMLCSTDQLAKENRNGFYISTRGLVETLCALVWVNDNTDRLPSLVQLKTSRLGAMLNSGYAKYSDLKQVYSYLSSFTHPSRNSHLLSPRPQNESREKGIWTPFGLKISDYLAKEMFTTLLVTGSRIMDEFEKLISGGVTIMKKGRIMAQLKKRDNNNS